MLQMRSCAVKTRTRKIWLKFLLQVAAVEPLVKRSRQEVGKARLSLERLQEEAALTQLIESEKCPDAHFVMVGDHRVGLPSLEIEMYVRTVAVKAKKTLDNLQDLIRESESPEPAACERRDAARVAPERCQR